MRKRISIDRRWRWPAQAANRPATLEVGLQFEPLEERRLLAGIPELLANLNPGGSSDPVEFINAGGTVFFSGDNGTNGRELWMTDGAPGGTLMVKDISPLAASSSPAYLTAVGGTLFFSADDGTNGVELWKSDGTPGGTTLVKNINPAGSSSPGQLINVDGTLYFRADDGTNGAELWKSDGTELGTTMVADINPAGSSLPRYLTNVDGTLFFSADNGVDGRELWMSDPVGPSTVLVKDINPGVSGSSPGYFGSMENVGGTLFFSAFDSTSGFELWQSDGTSVGTTLVRDVNPGIGSSFPFVMANVGGTLYFSGDGGANGFELWKSDGTFAGTTQVKDINPAVGVGSIPDGLANMDGTLYFRANDGTNGVELWKSDGTFGGTQMVLNINATGSSSPRYLTNVDGTLYFRASEGAGPGMTGTELWKSDGTPGGTMLAMDIAAGQNSSNPSQLTNVSGTLFFSAESTADNQEPWILHGSNASVVSQNLFYNQSTFDGNSPAIDANDDSAIASDKVAYMLDSGAATFASVSSYSKGINGIMFDLAGTHDAISLSDLTLQVGASNAPASWPLAPAPLEMAVREGAGIGGSDRVELIWANGAIKKTWLQVTVKANFNTNLASPHAFLFGNAVGDTSMGNSPIAAVTNAVDEVYVRSSFGPSPLITNLADFNRDGAVTAADEIVARNNAGFVPLLNTSGVGVVNRRLFYNQSAFDGNDPAANSADDGAIASDKLAYLPGTGPATFVNFSSYSRGINGIMIDISGSHPGITVADFAFKAGANNTPSTWAAAPLPATVSVRSGAGIGGSDRVELIWDGDAIKNNWLEVTVAANGNTGLAAADIFYFGSRVGDTGSGSPTAAVTNASDEIVTMANIGPGATITNSYDYDRNGVVSAADSNVSRNNSGFTNKISISNPPAAPLEPFDSAGDPPSDETAGVLNAVGTSLTGGVSHPTAVSAASSFDVNHLDAAKSGHGLSIAAQSPDRDRPSPVRTLAMIERHAEWFADDELLDELFDEHIVGLRRL